MNKFNKFDVYDFMNANGCEWTYFKDEINRKWTLTWRHPSGLTIIETADEAERFEDTKIVLVKMLQGDLEAMLQKFEQIDNWFNSISDELAEEPDCEQESEPIPVLHWCIDKMFTQWSDGTITENFGHRFIEPDEILDFKGNMFPTYEEAVNHAIGYARGRVA